MKNLILAVVVFLIGVCIAYFYRGYNQEIARQESFSKGYFKGYMTHAAKHPAHVGYGDDLTTWVGIGNENI